MSRLRRYHARRKAMSQLRAGSISERADRVREDRPGSGAKSLESKGSQETRATIQQSNGTSIRIVNGGKGVLQKTNGSLLSVNPLNTQAEYVRYVPALSLLSQIQNPSANVALVSSASTNGTADDIISVSLSPSNDPAQASIQSQTTWTQFSINHASGLVDEIEYNYYPEDGSAKMDVQELFSDYRNVGGFLVPYHRTTYRDGNLESDLQLQTVAFNVGLPDSDFALPQVQP
jgi:hypothetical protein